VLRVIPRSSSTPARVPCLHPFDENGRLTRALGGHFSRRVCEPVTRVLWPGEAHFPSTDRQICGCHPKPPWRVRECSYAAPFAPPARPVGQTVHHQAGQGRWPDPQTGPRPRPAKSVPWCPDSWRDRHNAAGQGTGLGYGHRQSSVIQRLLCSGVFPCRSGSASAAGPDSRSAMQPPRLPSM
jgi:hypothetical protein